MNAENTESPAELALVIPVYNEEEAIGKVVEDWATMLDGIQVDYRLHIYNDGSKDNTLGILEQMQSRFPKLVVHDKANSGHGPTILKGYRENVNAEWLFQVDSDDELGPEPFEAFWKLRERQDFVIGRRSGRASSLSRKLVTRMSRWVVRMLYGPCRLDVNCPYRLMRAEIFKDCFQSIPDDTVAPNVLIAGYAVLKKMRIREMKVPHRARTTGELTWKWSKTIRLSLQSFLQTLSYRNNPACATDTIPQTSAD